MLSKLIVERDWSAQECMHILLGCYMYGCSREIINLNISWPWSDEVIASDEMGEDHSTAAKVSWVDRYELHPPGVLNNVSLLQLFRYYRWDKGEFKKRKKAGRIVNIWPTYYPDKEDPSIYENYCRAKLQLHHLY